MPRFYVDAPLRAGGACELAEDSAHHAIHVMRLREGDDAVLFNGRGGEYAARVASIHKLRISLDVLQHRPIERESPLAVTLVQGISSGERMDFTVRKSVELGATAIQPVLAGRSVVRLAGERGDAKRAHWRRIAISACEQCGRNRIPEVLEAVPVAQYQAPADAMKILLSPLSRLAFGKLEMKGPAFVLAAGPEDGFTPEEEAHFAAAGFVPASLGPRVLRTETAAVAALAALSALDGEFR